jgi:hypothetical protein
VDSALAWKRFYAEERSELGRPHLLGLLATTPPLALAAPTAVVLPHTRLEVTGRQLAAAVNGLVASGVGRVLALGVLHGGRRGDAAAVAAARAGDAAALAALRGVHDEHGLAAEEFSLDAFGELLALAGEQAGRSIELVRRYPFLVGDDPATLPGLDELVALVADGARLVVTTDPVHHGHAYGTPAVDCADAADATTVAAARAALDVQLDALSGHRFAEFQALAARHRSDFRDTGPVLAVLLGRGFTHTVHEVALVDYAEVLAAPRPTWVAGALVTVAP